jgi:hypothetical protein
MCARSRRSSHLSQEFYDREFPISSSLVCWLIHFVVDLVEVGMNGPSARISPVLATVLPLDLEDPDLTLTGDMVQYNVSIYYKYIVSIFHTYWEYTHNILGQYISSVFHISQVNPEYIQGLYMLSILANILSIYLQYTEPIYSNLTTIYGLRILQVYCNQTIQKRKKKTFLQW